MTAERAVWVLESIYAPTYANEHPITKAVIAAIPEGRADYKADTVVRSAIDLAWHTSRQSSDLTLGGFTRVVKCL